MQLGDRYRAMREFTPAVLEGLRLRADPDGQELLTAVEMLRDLNRRGARRVPADAPIGFGPAAGGSNACSCIVWGVVGYIHVHPSAIWSSRSAHSLSGSFAAIEPLLFRIGRRMTKASQQKVVQYLHEARASEDALFRVLQSQIAMTPRGSYRGMLETHPGQSRDHAARVGERLKAVDEGSSPLMAVVGFWGDVVGQALAFSKTPFALLRGSGGEEKVLKSAKDACATEALEIATYTAIERLARSVGDQETATLAASILADEWKMLARVLREIPSLTEAVVRAEVKDQPSYDLGATGAADAVREAGAAARDAARRATDAAKSSRGQTRPRGVVAQAIAGW